MASSRNGSFGTMQIVFFFTLILSFPALILGNAREAIEIGIGIGIGGSSPPYGSTTRCPPPPSPKPSPSPPPPSPKPSPSPPKPRSPPPPIPKQPPPPKPRGLQPSDFENIYIYKAYQVIQRFKRTITCDNKYVRTWRGSNVCNDKGKGYAGIYCEIPPSRKSERGVASVDFNSFRICSPTFQGLVDRLPDLALFHANSNNFGKTVPDLTKLKFFYELDVSNNKLSSQFPVNVLPLVNLAFLDLRFNIFQGPVPRAVFNIKTQVLFLNNNQFNESIPDNLGSTPANYLTFANNKFTGPIPRSIGKACDTLIEVLFLNNSLSSCLPYEIGLLKKATVFDAGFNKLTGPIPLSFGCLRKVEQLNLACNLLYGEVPDVVCRLGKFGNLANLSLSNNYFTSLGHSCYDLIQRKKLDVRNNCIPGLPSQRSRAECEYFLKRPKTCPYLFYIPCSLPAEGQDMLDSVAALPEAEAPVLYGGQDRSPKSGYTTYSALHVHDKP